MRGLLRCSFILQWAMRMPLDRGTSGDKGSHAFLLYTHRIKKQTSLMQGFPFNTSNYLHGRENQMFCHKRQTLCRKAHQYGTTLHLCGW